MQKWSKKRQTAVSKLFTLHIPTIALDVDPVDELLPISRSRGAGGLLAAPEEASTLSWQNDGTRGRWRAAILARKATKALNFRDVYRVDVWETPTPNLIPGAHLPVHRRTSAQRHDILAGSE